MLDNLAKPHYDRLRNKKVEAPSLRMSQSCLDFTLLTREVDGLRIAVSLGKRIS